MIATRAMAVICAFAVFLVFLTGTIFCMQVFSYDEYQQKVMDEITAGASLKADRGTIYDSNMNVLATNITVWRIFISPVDIQKAKKKDGVRYDDIIADGLSEILSVDRSSIYEKAQKSGRLDETIKKNVIEDDAKKVSAFIADNELTGMIHMEAGSMRYYPMSTLASHTIGFTGSDNQGLFGLEAYYDEQLTGTDGKYITAYDSHGTVLPNQYSSYIAPEDGLSLVTTIDIYVQAQLERQIEAARLNSDAQNRIAGIVMNVNTGEIYAMATSSPYDCNNPYTLCDFYAEELAELGYEEGSEQYTAAKSTLLYKMWRNKAVSEAYEPGSTFKAVTSAIAMEEGLVSASDHFNCPGYYVVGGQKIKCHKVTGHGNVDFAEGLQQSCNPVLMQISERIGGRLFYQYFEAFGYLSKTGIDLPGETGSATHSEEALMNPVNLAVASFGQRFEVSLLQQVRAIAVLANGGRLVQPHLIKNLVDSDGNIVYTYDNTKGEQVISRKTAIELSGILEDGVSGNGGAKNAYVRGYKVAAKTGTSQIFDGGTDTGLRVGSCVAYAPSDDASIAAIIMVDSPTGSSIYGSTVAAPYISGLLESVLPYLGHEPAYSEGDTETLNTTVGNYVGYTLADAKEKASELGLTCRVIGNGGVVTSQTPAGGTTVNIANGCVILYTANADKEYTYVPDVIGLTAAEANKQLASKGLNIVITGAQNLTAGVGARVVSQSINADERVARGSVITIFLMHTDGTD